MLHRKPAEIAEVIASVLSQFFFMFLCKCLLEEPISSILTLAFLMMTLCSDLFRENPKLQVFREVVWAGIRGLLHA